MSTTERKSFLGTGWSFPPEFSRNGVAMVSDHEDIEQSLFIVLSTSLGERVMRPDFGSNLRAQVFENLDEGTKALIKDSVRRAILFHEPRVVVDRVRVETDLEEPGVARVSIEYVVTATNNRRNMVYPFYLTEGTDVEP